MTDNFVDQCVHFDCPDRTDFGYCKYTSCMHPIYSKSDGLKMLPSNIICPKCKSFRHMYHLYGDNVGTYNMKCLNCNTYFSSEILFDDKSSESQEEPNICKMEWIDVKDKLPDNDDFVIVAIYDDHGDSPYMYTDFGWYFERANCWIVDAKERDDVIYWMPLPEPPIKGRI